MLTGLRPLTAPLDRLSNELGRKKPTNSGAMDLRIKTHSLLATSRVANIPSVVCNVWAGALIQGYFGNPIFHWDSLIMVISAGIFLYISGNFLNDWMDKEWDRQYRPERALPRRLFKPTTFLVLAVSFATIGLFLAFSANGMAAAAAFGIVLLIVIYTAWHKQSPWLVIPMGLCRAFLPIMGALGMMTDGINPKTLVIAALAGSTLFFYIVGLSLSARGESNPKPSNLPKFLSLACFSASVTMILPLAANSQASVFWLLAPVPLLSWLILCQSHFRKPISKHVSALLAGIPFVDCITLIPLSCWMLAAGTHSLPTISLILPPLAFLSALALQRLAPAT